MSSIILYYLVGQEKHFPTYQRTEKSRHVSRYFFPKALYYQRWEESNIPVLLFIEDTRTYFTTGFI